VYHRAPGTLAGVRFGVLAATVFGFAVLAVAACGNGQGAPVSRYGWSGATCPSSSSDETIPGACYSYERYLNDRVQVPEFVACLASHGVTMTMLIDQGDHGLTPPLVSALNACSRRPIRS
jgi:hypothetical protein